MSTLCVLTVNDGGGVVLHTLRTDGQFDTAPLPITSVGYSSSGVTSAPFMFNNVLHMLDIYGSYRSFRICRIEPPNVLQIMMYTVHEESKQYIVDDTERVLEHPYRMSLGPWIVDRHENILFVWQQRSIVCVDLNTRTVTRHIPMHMMFGDTFVTEAGHVTIMRAGNTHTLAAEAGVTHIYLPALMSNDIYDMRVFAGVVYFRQGRRSYRVDNAHVRPVTVVEITDDHMYNIARMRHVGGSLRADLRPAGVRVVDVVSDNAYEIPLLIANTHYSRCAIAT